MFFTQFNQLMAGSVDITMVIRKSATGMTVSVLPKSNGLKDEARNHIVPLTLSGTPEELDGGFFQTIARPVRKVSGLLTNMAEFEKRADKAASESRAAKEAKAKETREEKEKREKYERLVKKADELAAAGNHKEAVTVLGQAKAYANPQQTKEIEDKIKAQTAELSKGSLFGMEDLDRQPVRQAPQPRPAQVQTAGMDMHPRQPAQCPGSQPAYHEPVRPYPGQERQYPPRETYGRHPMPDAQQPAAGFESGMQPMYAGHQSWPGNPSPDEQPNHRPGEYDEYIDFPEGMLKEGNQYSINNQMQ